MNNSEQSFKKNPIRRLLDNEAVMYILVGGSNTLIGWVLSYLLPRYLKMGFWMTSAVGMAVGGVYSYLLNKKFTFKAADESHAKTLPKFILNMILCYAISYGGAKYLFDIFFDAFSFGLAENLIVTLKLIGANLVYIVVNYIGQKFFAFKKDKSASAKNDDTKA